MVQGNTTEDVFMKKLISSNEKRAILKDILGVDYNEQAFPAFSLVIDYVGNLNDGLSLAELLPSLNRYLSGPIASRIVSYSSLMGALLFPVGSFLKLIDSNRIGHSMYGYRAATYTLTAWAFDDPVPTGSLRILVNLRTGIGARSQSVVTEYKDVWSKVSRDALDSIKRTCLERNILENHLKILFRAVGNGDPRELCKQVLSSFENRFTNTTINIWRSNYAIPYPA